MSDSCLVRLFIYLHVFTLDEHLYEGQRQH